VTASEGASTQPSAPPVEAAAGQSTAVSQEGEVASPDKTPATGVTDATPQSGGTTTAGGATVVVTVGGTTEAPAPPPSEEAAPEESTAPPPEEAPAEAAGQPEPAPEA
jgi:hypothetical protein